MNNEYFIIDNIVYIKLLAKIEELYTTISLDMFDEVSKYSWYLSKSGYPFCYELGRMQLHRYIYTLINGELIPSNIYVDHIDRNKLNNVNTNLRLVTPQQNSFNKTPKNNMKGIKKVSDSNYRVSVTKNGKTHSISKIKSLDDAKEIHSLMSQELFGEYFCPNN
jgi:hypothetical protein